MQRIVTIEQSKSKSKETIIAGLYGDAIAGKGNGNQEGGSNVVRQDADYLMTGVGSIDRQWCGKRQTAVQHFIRNGSAV